MLFTRKRRLHARSLHMLRRNTMTAHPHQPLLEFQVSSPPSEKAAPSTTMVTGNSRFSKLSIQRSPYRQKKVSCHSDLFQHDFQPHQQGAVKTNHEDSRSPTTEAFQFSSACQ